MFENQFENETLRSERRRALVVALTFLALCILAFFLQIILDRAPAGLKRDLFGLELRTWLVGLLFAIVVYEFFMWALLAHAGRMGRTWTTVVRYLNALVETSIPTGLILLLAKAFGPVNALSLPPVFLYFIFILLAALRLDLKLCLFTGVVAALEYSLLAAVLIHEGTGSSVDATAFSPMLTVGKPILLLIGGVTAGFVSTQIMKQVVNSIDTVEEHERVLDIFGQHVSPAVVQKLIGCRMKSEVRKVCVMFLDIRGFTAFSEKKDPEEVVAYLNGLFELTVETVNSHGGVVNKFLGDGFMALFGAPISTGNESANAVRAALAIAEEVRKAGAEGRIPPTRIGIGLHAGEAVTGNVGSARRKEYSIIGDVVNLASRVEALNKEFDSQILITGAAYEAAGRLDEIKAEPLGMVTVKGREQPVQVYRLA